MKVCSPVSSRLFAAILGLLAVLVPSSAAADLADGEDFELVIIAPSDFLAPLIALERFKDATGLPADVTELERVLEMFPAHPEYDSPERVKRALSLWKTEYGIRYAMLVGDVDRFPVRWVTREELDDPSTVLYYYPSDLYYADLSYSTGAWCSWDHDGNGHFGEHLASSSCDSDPYSSNLDRCDFHPDLAVGRVPASTVEEVDRYVAKVIQYELGARGSAWARNVLLMAGSSRSRDCDPGIHFADIQNSLGAWFSYRVFVHESYYDDTLDGDRDCRCHPPGVPNPCACLSAFTSEQADVFRNATRWIAGTSPIPDSEFTDVGFLAWHDHTSSVRDYRQVDNRRRYSVAFSDGCSDGGFAGGPPGDMARFAPTSAGGHELPYLTEDGRLFHIIFAARYPVDTDGNGVLDTNDTKYYCVLRCEVDGRSYFRSGDRFEDISPALRFPYPDLRVEDDFGAGCVMNPSALPLSATPRYKDGLRYIYNAPRPAPVQPQPDVPDYDAMNPETKLFALHRATGEETGWVGLVAATKSASFPVNGELEALFFRGYLDPHPSVEGRDRLGDMWRSMFERYLELVVDPATGRFDFTAYARKYLAGADPDYARECSKAIEHLTMYTLFGDPSLRVGGVPGIEDLEGPTTTRTVRGDGERTVEVEIRATDGGDPASGVRRVRYTVDGGPERIGHRFSVEGDGDHRIWYQAEDYAGNRESPSHSFVAHVDGVAPQTSVVSVEGPTDAILDCRCSGGACYPPGGCFSGDVTVTLEAADGDSGVGFVEYFYPGMPPGLLGLTRIYHGPFVISRPEDAASLTLSYRCVDAGGNAEPWREATICFCNYWSPSLMGTRLVTEPACEGTVSWALLEDRIPDPSDIQTVAMAYAVRGPGEPQWIVASVDSEGKDGWRLAWDTTKLPDGEYFAQLAVFGFPAKPGGSPVLLHSEQRPVVVCNIPAAEYQLTLEAPGEVARGASVPFTVRFSHKRQGDVSGATLTCDLDPELFAGLDVLDGGSLDPSGRPRWLRARVPSGEVWTARFKGRLHKDIEPEALLWTRASLKAEGVSLLVSDDPSTPRPRDPTGIKVLPAPADLEVIVRGDRGETPVKATVKVKGPVDRTESTGEGGSCRFEGLPPGTYWVDAEAPSYEHAVPAGSVALDVKGIGESLQVEFCLRAADRLPPQSHLSLPAQAIVEGKLAEVSGAAADEPGGSGLAKVEVWVQRLDDGLSWDGQGWREGAVWLRAKGAESWDLSLGAVPWRLGASYAIATRATDRAGNVEVPRLSRGGVPRTPTLVAPPDGSTVDAPPTFEWSSVPGCAYRIQIALGGDFEAPEVDRAGVVGCAFAPRALPAGKWSWRVRALRTPPIEHGEGEHLIPMDIEEPAEASAWSPPRTVFVKGGGFSRGDSNADGRTDLSDAVTTLGNLFLGGAMNDCSDAADVNDDGKIDISDPVRLLGHLFLGSERPPDPFEACGEDPTEDELVCRTFPGCP